MGILDKLFGKHEPKHETLGNTEPVCPYCAKPLDKMPGRKTKCPFCANYMYVRTRPGDKKRVVVTGQDAAKIDEQWGKETRFEGPPVVAAIQNAKARGAEIAAKYEIAPESANRIAEIVSDGIKNKRGISGLASDIRREFPDMTTERARSIALTETSEALSHASLKRMHDMGIEGKAWLTGNASCQICARNEDEGVIATSKPFPSGHMCPPAHEGCRCTLTPALLGGKGPKIANRFSQQLRGKEKRC